MALYDITYENIGYTSNPALDGQSLSAEQLRALEAALKEHPSWPKAVRGIQEVRASEDDGQPNVGERKMFTDVVLRVEAEDEDAAERLPVPKNFLDRVFGHFNVQHRGDLEPQETWEVLDMTDCPVEAPVPARRTQRLR
jgi:hypothetical protein